MANAETVKNKHEKNVGTGVLVVLYQDTRYVVPYILTTSAMPDTITDRFGKLPTVHL